MRTKAAPLNSRFIAFPANSVDVHYLLYITAIPHTKIFLASFINWILNKDFQHLLQLTLVLNAQNTGGKTPSLLWVEIAHYRFFVSHELWGTTFRSSHQKGMQIDLGKHQIQAQFWSCWLQVSKIKHVLASYTGKLQMQFMIMRQVGDRQFCLTDIVTDLLILLKGYFKLKSLYFTAFGNHFIDSCYFTSLFSK